MSTYITNEPNDVDSNDGLLDEELDAKINEVTQELNSLETPQTIESGLDKIDSEIINELYDNVSKTPRDKIMELIASMGQSRNNLGSDYQFGGISQKTKEQAKEKLTEKIALMKNKRKQKSILKQQQEKYEFMQKIKQEQQEELNLINSSSIVGDGVEFSNNTDTTNIEEAEYAKPLTKSQKKRMKQKDRLIKKKLSEGNSDNSDNSDELDDLTKWANSANSTGLTWSDSEEHK